MSRTVRLLGLCRRCASCGEEWPLDAEFFRQRGSAFNHVCRACEADRDRKVRRPRSRPVGPARCQGCNERVTWSRGAWRDPVGLTHRCGVR